MPTSIPMLRYAFDTTIEIYPIGDLHVGSKEFEEGAFQKVCREIMAADNRYVVLTGDLIDNGTRGSVTGPYGATMQPRAQREYAAELLYPLRDRVLAMVGGNHCRRSINESDTDPGEIIAAKLGIEDKYRTEIAFLDVKCGERSSNHDKRRPRYVVGVAHGAGGGTLLGSPLNRIEPFAIATGVDLMITGHVHKGMTAPTARLEADRQGGRMVQREVRILIGTAYLSYGGYPAEKLMRPVTIRPNKAILSDKEFDIAVLS